MKQVIVGIPATSDGENDFPEARVVAFKSIFGHRSLSISRRGTSRVILLTKEQALDIAKALREIAK